jgi:hypothetical protein
MTEPRSALLLVGSPKPAEASVSASLGGFLLKELKEKGWNTQTMRLLPLMANDESRGKLRQAETQADLCILSFPLYVDTFPAVVIEGLEESAIVLQGVTGKRLCAIVNCGFPEAHHCSNVLGQCRLFARQNGMEWAGGAGPGDGRSDQQPGTPREAGRHDPGHPAGPDDGSRCLGAGVGHPGTGGADDGQAADAGLALSVHGQP